MDNGLSMGFDLATPMIMAQSETGGMVVMVWGLAFIMSIVALVQAWMFFKSMMAADEGNERMVEIAGYVREGANTYLFQQYKVVGVFFAVIFVLLAIASFGLGVQSKFVPFAFLTAQLELLFIPLMARMLMTHSAIPWLAFQMSRVTVSKNSWLVSMAWTVPLEPILANSWSSTVPTSRFFKPLKERVLMTALEPLAQVRET